MDSSNSGHGLILRHGIHSPGYTYMCNPCTRRFAKDVLWKDWGEFGIHLKQTEQRALFQFLTPYPFFPIFVNVRFLP